MNGRWTSVTAAASLLALFAIALGSGSSRYAPQAGPRLLITPYRASGIYNVGEMAGWDVRLPEGPDVLDVKYTIKENNAVLIDSGIMQVTRTSGHLGVKMDHPAMVYAEITVAGGKPMALGAAISPTRLRPVQPRPRDFDAFWKRKIRELHEVPENAVLTPGQSGDSMVDYATIRMDHVNGTHVFGQIAKPKSSGKHPALLILQWASPPYRLWAPWVVDRAKEGWIALNIEPHDVLPTEPQSYYNALPEALKNYNGISQDDRERNYFVEMYLRDYRAVDFLSKLPDWDGKTLVVMGTSMGGQQSFAVAGLHPRVTHMLVNVPPGADLVPPTLGRQEGYPYYPTNIEKVMETARYIDAVNFAPRIRATSLVAMGFVDTVSPPAGIWTVFNQIRGRKEAVPMVDSPHNNFATAEQQRPWTERSAAWLNRLVKGERLEILPFKG